MADENCVRFSFLEIEGNKMPIFSEVPIEPTNSVGSSASIIMPRQAVADDLVEPEVVSNIITVNGQSFEVGIVDSGSLVENWREAQRLGRVPTLMEALELRLNAPDSHPIWQNGFRVLLEELIGKTATGTYLGLVQRNTEYLVVVHGGGLITPDAVGAGSFKNGALILNDANFQRLLNEKKLPGMSEALTVVTLQDVDNNLVLPSGAFVMIDELNNVKNVLSGSSNSIEDLKFNNRLAKLRIPNNDLRIRYLDRVVSHYNTSTYGNWHGLKEGTNPSRGRLFRLSGYSYGGFYGGGYFGIGGRFPWVSKIN